MWLGNESRSFYGTGPWSDGPLEVVWEFETGFISGRLHKDPWGGSSWPGQPSVDERHVYFGSADGNLYCLDKRDGRLVWKYKTNDSLKATPTIAGDKLIASGLDHYIYCIDKDTGTLIWKYKTGFEVDCSAAVIDGRVYFGSEDGFFYSLNLEDGALIYKTERPQEHVGVERQREEPGQDVGESDLRHPASPPARSGGSSRPAVGSG
jgi:outer membrane protein assembly factor BamB